MCNGYYYVFPFLSYVKLWVPGKNFLVSIWLNSKIMFMNLMIETLRSLIIRVYEWWLVFNNENKVIVNDNFQVKMHLKKNENLLYN